jgi:hypothetical protein
MLLSSTWGAAQSSSIEGVRKMYLRNSGPIQENNKLVGYYTFYLYDKVDSKTNAYYLTLTDVDLNVVHELKMKKPKTTVLMEMIYNGEIFSMLFIDTKEKVVSIETYDRKAQKVGDKILQDAHKWELMRLQAAGEDGEVNESLFPLGDHGFVKLLTVKNEKISYELRAFNNDMTKKWTYAPKESGMMESANVVWTNDKYMLITIMKMKNAFDKPDHAFLLLVDTETGKKVFETKMIQSGNNLSVLNGFIDPGTQQIYLVGEYYGASDNLISDKSLGLYVMQMDMGGQAVKYNKFSRDGDLKKLSPPDDKGKQNFGYVFFHRVVRTKDGGFHLIGEQFKKAVSAWGMADKMLNARNSTASSFSLWVDNMVVAKLNSDLELTGVEVYDKAKSEVIMPAGAAYWSPTLMAHYVRQYDGFDYAFTITDPDKDRYFASYVDFDRKKGDSGEKIGSYVGTIVYDGGTTTLDKLPIKSSSSNYRVLPGKPGNVVLLEYFRKEKRMEMRLEKVNY